MKRQQNVPTFSHGQSRRAEYKAHVTAALAKGLRPHFYSDWFVMTQAIEGARSPSSVRVAKRTFRVVR